MSKKKIFVIIVIIIAIVFGAYKFMTKKPVAKEATKLEEINTYPYVLYSNSTKLYKSIFKELKEVLSKNEVDEEKYASLLAKLFVADFYDLDSKATSTDIGGTEFIHKALVDNFKVKAADTIYKGVESNVYGNRKQILPALEDFESASVKTVKYDKNEIRDFMAYQVDLRWKYKVDLAYQSNASIILVHDEKLLVIVDIK